jgi:hypothetical protein
MKHAEGAEEALHGMRGGHLPAWHLHHGRVAFLPLQVVEITQVPTAAIEEKVQGLQKQIAQRNPLGTFLEASELVQQQGHDADGLHVLDEKRQAAAAGQRITSDFELIIRLWVAVSIEVMLLSSECRVQGMERKASWYHYQVSLAIHLTHTPDTNKKPHG